MNGKYIIALTCCIAIYGECIGNQNIVRCNVLTRSIAKKLRPDANGHLHIPDDYTAIGDSAFELRKDIKSLTMSNNVKSIGESAFYGCSQLKSVKLPNRLKVLKYNTFACCDKLSFVAIPNSMMAISLDAFLLCEQCSFTVYDERVKNLFDVNIYKDRINVVKPPENEEIELWWYPNKDGHLKIPDHITKIDDFMFYCRL